MDSGVRDEPALDGARQHIGVIQAPVAGDAEQPVQQEREHTLIAADLSPKTLARRGGDDRFGEGKIGEPKILHRTHHQPAPQPGRIHTQKGLAGAKHEAPLGPAQSLLKDRGEEKRIALAQRFIARRAVIAQINSKSIPIQIQSSHYDLLSSHSKIVTETRRRQRRISTRHPFLYDLPKSENIHALRLETLLLVAAIGVRNP